MSPEQQAPLHRSYLFVPADDPAKARKAPARGADVIVLDLEDAVDGRDKSAARSTVAELVAEPRPVEVHVRPARDGDGYDLADLQAATGPGLRGLRLPKVDEHVDWRGVDVAVRELEREAGLAPGTVGLYPTFESAAAVLAAETILRSCAGLVRPVFGEADFAADIGAGSDLAGATLHARSHLVLCARAAGCGPPIDGAYTVIDDLPGLRRRARRSRNLGFFGASVIHPAQIAVVNEAFTPTQEELASARRIVAAFEAAAEAHRGVAVVEGQMVDPAVVRRARGLVRIMEALT